MQHFVINNRIHRIVGGKDTYIFPINIKNYDLVRDPFNVSISNLVDLKLAEEENLKSIKSDRTLQLKFKKFTF